MKYEHLHLATHTELGDLLVTEGIIRHYAAVYQRLSFDTAYYDEAVELFDDLDNVEPLAAEKDYVNRRPVPKDADKVIWFGLLSDVKRQHGIHFPDTKVRTFDHLTWDREFYRMLDVPFMARWLNSNLPAPEGYPDICKSNSILVHQMDDYKIEFNFEDTPEFIGPRDGCTAFAWMKPIMRARQVHCIDSSMVSLIESMNANGYLNPRTELFYHAEVRPSAPPVMLAPWKIVL
jgi:hypothetical protein